MAVVAQVQVRVDASQAVKNLNSVNSAATTGQQKLGNLGKAAGGAQTKLNSLKGAASQLGTVLRGVAGVAIIGFLNGASKAASSFESETLLLERGLRNVGAGAAELDRLQQSADRLGKETLFNEEDFRQGFGLLTSFGNIGVKSYDSVAMAAANVAQVSGTDVSSAFMQLAKALNDPIANLSALSRSGIQFTEQQKATIKGLVETGQEAKAQSMILQELERQYGGTAIAAAGGAAGIKDTFGEAMYDLQKAVGGVVNTALPPLLSMLTNIINAFTALPEPVQTVIVGLVALAAAAAVLAPLVSVVMSLGPAFAAIGGAISAVIGLLTGGGGIMAAIAAVFSGPVGWIALAVAAGVAIYTFRDQIGAAFAKIGEIIKAAWNIYKSIWIDPVINAGKAIYNFFEKNWDQIYDTVSGVVKKIFDFYKKTFIDPVLKLGKKLVDGISDAFIKVQDVVSGAAKAAFNFFNNTFVKPIVKAGGSIYKFFAQTFAKIKDAITAPFVAAFAIVRGVVNSILRGIATAINGVVNAVNFVVMGVNNATSKVGLPPIPLVPTVSVPQFAEGGVVNGPTLAIVGEGGEPEYIIPQSKAAGFAANYLKGARGASAIPAFAEGGYVGPINVQTGPVMQQGGTNYVTMAQFEKGLMDLATAVSASNRSYGARQYMGVQR